MTILQLVSSEAHDSLHLEGIPDPVQNLAQCK